MNYIYLKFNNLPILSRHYETEQERMLRWCKNHGMEMHESNCDDSIIVRFGRDKNTYDFIKEFLESKVEHALPFKSLESIPGVKIIKLYPEE